MKKTILWIIGCSAILLFAINAQAYYFSIQLHNGNEMRTLQYWDDGEKISFYTRSGTVSLPKTTIKNIVRVDGELESETVYFATDFLTGLADEPEPDLPLQDWEDDISAEQQAEFIADLRDRINIINANLENLQRNREVFMREREGYEQDRERARQRIEETRRESLLATDERTERIQLEEARIKDAEAKMSRVDERIRNNARLIDAQNNMKTRLERDLMELSQR